ncbi:MAG: hypothetical protein M3Y22_16985 [Pseudomonadota bacterium]|nr:hypothetical protein [Pseudomonadota bacterium]
MDLQQIVSDIGSSGALNEAATKAGASPDQAQGMLHGVLSHLNSGGSTDGMSEAVAAKAGVDPSLVSRFLPYVLPLLQQHAASAPQGAQAGLGGLLGTVSGALGGGGGGGGLAGLAEGFIHKG